MSHDVFEIYLKYARVQREGYFRLLFAWPARSTVTWPWYVSPSKLDSCLSKSRANLKVYVVDMFLISPSGFNSDCDNSFRLQKVLNLPQSPRTKWSFEAEIVPLLSFYNEVTHLFYWCFLLFMATRKIYFKEKKIWVVEVVCFRYEWQETPHLEPQWSMR